MTPRGEFGPHVLDIDCAAEADRIAAVLRGYLTDVRRKGFVVALSGGIDSSVTAALCVHAIGSDRVFGLHMPERASAPETIDLSWAVAESLGIDSEVEEIANALDAIGCYTRYDAALRTVVPECGPGWRSKIVLPDVTDTDALRLYSVVVEDPFGTQTRHRLSIDAYLGVVAATNFKQRIRKTLEYYHSDRLNYATTGTPNRLEYDQGFFVKLGDGAADIKPIAHLYKTQVYALAEYLEVPRGVRERPSTTDTYTLAQSQQEFYFSLPHQQMDLCLWAHDHDVPLPDVAAALDLDVTAVERVMRDIEQKRRSTRYLHLGPALVEPVDLGQ